MKRLLLFILLVPLFGAFAPGACATDLSAGLRIDDDGVKSFYLAVGEQYHAPEADLIAVRERHLPDEELPVLFFIARRANVAPSAVLALRLDGKSWMDISLHFNLNASTYYVDAGEVSGPPYGHAYGHFKKHKREKWHEIRLTDADIVNLVNLRFVSDHYGYAPSEIVKLRQQGKSFVDINRTVYERKHGKPKQSFANDDEPGNGNTNASNGNGNHKGNDKAKNKKGGKKH